MNYEQKFLYRLIKVLYIVALLLSVPVLFLINYFTYRPTKQIDNSKSYVSNCYQNKLSTFNDIGLYFYSDNFYLDKDKELVINYYCAYGRQRDTVIYEGFKPNYPLYKSYGEIYPAYTTNGSWLKVIGYTSISLLVIYSLLSIIRETLNYIFLGKKFDFCWIKWPFKMWVKKA